MVNKLISSRHQKTSFHQFPYTGITGEKAIGPYPSRQYRDNTFATGIVFCKLIIKDIPHPHPHQALLLAAFHPQGLDQEAHDLGEEWGSIACNQSFSGNAVQTTGVLYNFLATLQVVKRNK